MVSRPTTIRTIPASHGIRLALADIFIMISFELSKQLMSISGKERLIPKMNIEIKPAERFPYKIDFPTKAKTRGTAQAGMTRPKINPKAILPLFEMYFEIFISCLKIGLYIFIIAITPVII